MNQPRELLLVLWRQPSRYLGPTRMAPADLKAVLRRLGEAVDEALANLRRQPSRGIQRPLVQRGRELVLQDGADDGGAEYAAQLPGRGSPGGPPAGAAPMTTGALEHIEAAQAAAASGVLNVCGDAG